MQKGIYVDVKNKLDIFYVAMKKVELRFELQQTYSHSDITKSINRKENPTEYSVWSKDCMQKHDSKWYLRILAVETVGT